MKNKSPLLALGFFMLSSFQLEAQNDSVKINTTIDTITIGNMIIIKNKVKIIITTQITGTVTRLMELLLI